MASGCPAAPLVGLADWPVVEKDTFGQACVSQGSYGDGKESPHQLLGPM